MRLLPICLAIIVLNSVAGAEPEADRVKKLFRSEYYTVSWGTPALIKTDADLEVGDGSGHGGTLAWLRFRPEKDRINVLRVQFDIRRQPDSKKSPDGSPVRVHRAEMKPDAYTVLLGDLAMVAAAKLKEAAEIPNGFGTADFWVYARLSVGKKQHLDEDWAGYPTSREAEFAKPQAAVTLARDAVTKLDFKEYTLTAEERGWASEKFARDWKKFEGKEYYWWVREWYLEVIGTVGDKSVLPTLRDILASELPKDHRMGASKYRCAAHAVTATERLTKSKLWGPEGQDGDINTARRKALDLLRDKK